MCGLETAGDPSTGGAISIGRTTPEFHQRKERKGKMDARVGNAEVGGQETGDDSLPPSISFVLWE